MLIHRRFCLVSAIALFCTFSLSQICAAQSDANPAPKIALPAAWLGQWVGEAVAYGQDGKPNRFQMTLQVAKTSDANRWQWQITYDGAQGKSVREYELQAVAGEPNRFAIDEKNSIVIPATLLGNSLCSHFEVSGQTIWSKYELLDGEQPSIQFELVSAAAERTQKSGGAGEIPTVSSLIPANRQSARLVKTNETQPQGNDAGNSLSVWRKLKTEPYRGKQDDIYFVNSKVGWYGNGAGKIYKTTDGGESWNLQLEQPGTFFRCLAFIDEQHGFAGNIGPGYFPNVTDANPLYETKDGGQSWHPITTVAGEPVVGLCAMQVLREEFINAGKLDTRIRLIGVGRVGGPIAMIVSDDLGATWQQIKLADHGAMAFDVHFFNRQEGFVASASHADVSQSNALILRTQDGGQTWQKVYQSGRPYELTWKIAFPSRQVGYVTIQSYNPDTKVTDRFVAKTTDGGDKWTEVPLTSNAAVREFGIAFLDESTGWVGAVPHGFFTNDGGKTWTKADIGNAVNKIRLVKEQESTFGFAIGTEVRTLSIPAKK